MDTNDKEFVSKKKEEKSVFRTSVLFSDLSLVTTRPPRLLQL